MYHSWVDRTIAGGWTGDRGFRRRDDTRKRIPSRLRGAVCLTAVLTGVGSAAAGPDGDPKMDTATPRKRCGWIAGAKLGPAALIGVVFVAAGITAKFVATRPHP